MSGQLIADVKFGGWSTFWFWSSLQSHNCGCPVLALQGRAPMLPMRFISKSRGASVVPTGLDSFLVADPGLTSWAILRPRSATGTAWSSLVTRDRELSCRIQRGKSSLDFFVNF